MPLRPAVLAGRWYPKTPEECGKFLDAIDGTDQGGGPAAIVPHAGWPYSGAIAFRALKRVHASRADADLVVLFGGHLAKLDEPRLFVDQGFETPFGAISAAESLAQDAGMAIEGCDLETAEEYYDDNGIEVLLPMIKRLWPAAPLLALGPPPTARAISIGKEALDLARRRGFKKVVIVGSTDLTHYGPNYDFQPKGRGHSGLKWVKDVNDPSILDPIAKLDAAQVIWSAERNHNACCAGSAAAAIAGAKLLGASRGTITEYATSFDVRPSSPEPNSFVGYAGVVLS